MKKLLFIIFILFTARAYPQTITYGISAGLNYTDLPGNSTLLYSLSNDYIMGFHIGGLMDIKFKAFSMQPGILYSTMGGQGKTSLFYGNGNITSGTNKIVLDYIEIPTFYTELKRAAEVSLLAAVPMLVLEYRVKLFTK
jgi:hypothetical protein